MNTPPLMRMNEQPDEPLTESEVTKLRNLGIIQAIIHHRMCAQETQNAKQNAYRKDHPHPYGSETERYFNCMEHEQNAYAQLLRACANGVARAYALGEYEGYESGYDDAVANRGGSLNNPAQGGAE